MFAMLLTAFSYGHMARLHPQAGSAFTYVGKEIHPGAGYLAGWCMAMDYVLNPLICTIWCSKAAQNFVPDIPYIVWVVVFATLFTLLNLNGVETSARMNAAMAAALGVVILMFVVAAVRFIMQVRHLRPIGTISRYPSTIPPPSRPAAPCCTAHRWRCSPTSDSMASRLSLRRRTIRSATFPAPSCSPAWSPECSPPSRSTWANWYGTTAAAFPEVDTAFVHVAGRAGGVVLFMAVNAALLVATIGSGMAAQLGAARLLYAMGRDGALPYQVLRSHRTAQANPQKQRSAHRIDFAAGSPGHDLRDRRRAAQFRRTAGLHGSESLIRAPLPALQESTGAQCWFCSARSALWCA